jgi:hypothetical protein
VKTPASPNLLSRRQAIGRLSVLLAGTIAGAEFFLRGTRVEGKESTHEFTAAQLALLDEIGDTIIPPTSTPGAKSVQIGAFMAMMVADCYDDAHQAAFLAGLEHVEGTAQERHGRGFVACTATERTALLEPFDHEARRRLPAGATPHFFRLMKEMTLIGYFTSETGCTQTLRYVEVPGSFNGDVPYRKGDRAWFTRARVTMS